jgi:phosphomannomutase
LPGSTLLYAYEEAIGHCVDPAAVRDKDGISAAVLACDLVAALRRQGRTILDALDELARRHGVHVTAAASRPADASAMPGLRADPPTRLCGFDVTVDDLSTRRGQSQTDALIFSGGDDATAVRVVVRPSGTEPKIKYYTEVRCAPSDDLTQSRGRAELLMTEVEAALTQW